MYVPQHFEERDIGVLHALIGTHPLGAWVTVIDGTLEVNHIPFLVDAARGEDGTLTGHVARANRVWKAFSRDVPSVVIFQGPQSYISPSWYPRKQVDRKAVPTWNYAVVHAFGIPRAIEDRAWLRQHVTALTAVHEAERAVPWRVADAPEGYIDSMLKAIVGIEVPIDRLVGKWKTSQNRTPSEQAGIVTGLREHGDESAQAMAALVERQVTGQENSWPR